MNTTPAKRKPGRPPVKEPRKPKEVWLTEAELRALYERAAQYGTAPGETIGIVLALTS